MLQSSVNYRNKHIVTITITFILTITIGYYVCHMYTSVLMSTVVSFTETSLCSYKTKCLMYGELKQFSWLNNAIKPSASKCNQF